MSASSRWSPGSAARAATPRSVERLMGASGLTLYQLKIQLQKYRLAMKRGSEASSHGREEEGGGDGRFLEHQRARQTPMEFRRKSEERLEVQRHLQLRIEAQGRYLQSVLERAREMLEMDAADSQPSPAADADCLSSDGSCLTENDGRRRGLRRRGSRRRGASAENPPQSSRISCSPCI
ncbi:unnamed protein product [Spirodela intermedia]|uniref:MYB-CC type transcription factor LHEQLE-containing domain-containing protein n=1 Tax=Spirodela intermedia TaxID=51605 RepID=A0A7I8J4N5_SPIIN|nr:unnamed protein product [Spirodela intermedia]CAA6665198.1 unnamed protein product [Spirodela intermedia]